MKKQYFQPTMKVVELKRQNLLLGGSRSGAQGISDNSEGISWKDGGFADSEDDY